MRILWPRLLILCFSLLWASHAHAGIPEARETARLNNCTPKKIEVYQSHLGSEGKIIYQVTCNLPKTTDKDSAAGPDALLIGCNQSLCELIRPLAMDKK